MCTLSLRQRLSVVGRRKLDGYWNPELSIENAMGEVGTQTDTYVETDDRGQTFVVETKRIRGTFSELLELHLFPFDIQVNMQFKLHLLYSVYTNKQTSSRHPANVEQTSSWLVQLTYSQLVEPAHRASLIV